MEKYRLKEFDAGLLSGGFENTGSGISFLSGLIDIFENYKEYASNPEEFIKKHPDMVFSGRITKVVTDRIIRPYVIISDKLDFMNKKDLSNILRFNVDLFSAYFLQAIKILANVYNVDLTMVTRQMTDRTLIKSTARAINLGKKVASKFGIGNEDLSSYIVKNLVSKVGYGLEDEDGDGDVDDNNKNNPGSNLSANIETNLTFKDAEKDLKINDGLIKVLNVDMRIGSKTGDVKNELKISIPFVIQL
jgi:hypothetical protein